MLQSGHGACLLDAVSDTERQRAAVSQPATLPASAAFSLAQLPLSVYQSFYRIPQTTPRPASTNIVVVRAYSQM